MMFNLGDTWIGQYRVWLAAPVFTEEDTEIPYYEVMITKEDPILHYYVNPIKEFLKLDLTDRNPLHRPKDKENLTPEELEFRTEHQSYVARKDMIMPLWKLSYRHVEILFIDMLKRSN
jgi:hypothetical protein